jgi:hypothetical protein
MNSQHRSNTSNEQFFGNDEVTKWLYKPDPLPDTDDDPYTFTPPPLDDLSRSSSPISNEDIFFPYLRNELNPSPIPFFPKIHNDIGERLADIVNTIANDNSEENNARNEILLCMNECVNEKTGKGTRRAEVDRSVTKNQVLKLMKFSWKTKSLYLPLFKTCLKSNLSDYMLCRHCREGLRKPLADFNISKRERPVVVEQPRKFQRMRY